MVRFLGFWAALTLLSGAAFATEELECTKKALAHWLGTWSCSTNYMNYPENKVEVATWNVRTVATENGYDTFMVSENGDETLVLSASYSQTAIVADYIDGPETSPRTQYEVVTSCSGPDDYGFSTVTTQSAGGPGDWHTLYRAVHRVSATGNNRSTGELSRNGDDWGWLFDRVCVALDEQTEPQ